LAASIPGVNVALVGSTLGLAGGCLGSLTGG